MINQIIAFWERVEYAIWPPEDGLFWACHEVERLTKMIDFQSLENHERVTVVLAMLAAKEAIDKALPKTGLTDESAVGVMHFMFDMHGIKH